MTRTTRFAGMAAIAIAISLLVPAAVFASTVSHPTAILGVKRMYAVDNSNPATSPVAPVTGKLYVKIGKKYYGIAGTLSLYRYNPTLRKFKLVGSRTVAKGVAFNFGLSSAGLYRIRFLGAPGLYPSVVYMQRVDKIGDLAAPSVTVAPLGGGFSLVTLTNVINWNTNAYSGQASLLNEALSSDTSDTANGPMFDGSGTLPSVFLNMQIISKPGTYTTSYTVADSDLRAYIWTMSAVSFNSDFIGYGPYGYYMPMESEPTATPVP